MGEHRGSPLLPGCRKTVCASPWLESDSLETRSSKCGVRVFAGNRESAFGFDRSPHESGKQIMPETDRSIPMLFVSGPASGHPPPSRPCTPAPPRCACARSTS